MRQKPYKLMLPLWRRVVFIDWFGVLSTQLFWHSILDNPRHPYHDRVKRASDLLFKENGELVKSWMCGKVSSETVLSYVEVELDRRSKSDFLLRRLHEDCRRAVFRAELLRAIRIAVDAAYVVIATDNMECFCRQAESMPGLMGFADDVLSSSNLGVLKMESVAEFFGPWLADHRLSFGAAVLIDDNARTCEAFRSRGGSAVTFENIEDTLFQVCVWANCSEGTRLKALAESRAISRGATSGEDRRNSTETAEDVANARQMELGL